MTDKLPPNLFALFAPRPPLRYLPPCDHAPEDRKTAPIEGIAAYMPALEEYKKTDVYEPTESWLQRKDRLKLEKQEAQKHLKEKLSSLYRPQEDPNIRGDAFKTLFIGRLPYDTTNKDLERVFGRYGAIERIRIVDDTQHQDKKPNTRKIKKHRGYAFMIYEREKDMRGALECDGTLIGGRPITVDVERGRTVRGWKPRRLGGGLGGRGYTKAALPRPMGPGGLGGAPGGPGGIGGGFRGGYDGGRGRGGYRVGGGMQDRGSVQYRGRYGGGRGGIGYQEGGDSRASGDRNGYGGFAPSNAPAGPGRGGYGSRGGYAPSSSDFRGPGSGGGHDARNSGRDRFGGGFGGDPYAQDRSGSNMVPVRERDFRRQDDLKRRFDDSSSAHDTRDDARYDPRKIRRY